MLYFFKSDAKIEVFFDFANIFPFFLWSAIFFNPDVVAVEMFPGAFGILCHASACCGRERVGWGRDSVETEVAVPGKERTACPHQLVGTMREAGSAQGVFL